MKALVTGSSAGIGLAVAKEFLDRGCQVVGMDLQPAGLEHPNYTHIQTDILTGELPPIPDLAILVNNAGVQDSGRDIEVNLKGTMRVTEQYAFHEGIQSVLFMASASARTGAEFPEYAASKGGMVAYMKNVAARLAPYGATANSLSPGGVITELNDHIIQDPKLWEAVLNETTLHKWATAEEIAQWTWFVTAVNRSMTGQDLLIDNGEAGKFNFIW